MKIHCVKDLKKVMSLQVIYLMADRSTDPYHTKDNKKITSDDTYDENNENDGNYNEKRLIKTSHPVLEKAEQSQVKHMIKNEKHAILKDKVPKLEYPKIQNSEMKMNYRVVSRSHSAVVRLGRTVGNGFLGLIHFMFQAFGALLDLTIDSICCDLVRNVFGVMITVTIEVFVVIVLAFTTIFAAIIVNIDEHCNRRHNLRFLDSNIRLEEIAENNKSERDVFGKDDPVGYHPIQETPISRPLRVQRNAVNNEIKNKPNAISVAQVQPNLSKPNFQEPNLSRCQSEIKNRLGGFSVPEISTKIHKKDFKNCLYNNENNPETNNNNNLEQMPNKENPKEGDLKKTNSRKKVAFGDPKLQQGFDLLNLAKEMGTVEVAPINGSVSSPGNRVPENDNCGCNSSEIDTRNSTESFSVCDSEGKLRFDNNRNGNEK